MLSGSKTPVTMRVGFLLMPLLPGTLYERLKTVKLTRDAAVKITIGLANAAAFLESKGIVHADIKVGYTMVIALLRRQTCPCSTYRYGSPRRLLSCVPALQPENILLDDQGEPVLFDFGLSTFVANPYPTG